MVRALAAIVMTAVFAWAHPAVAADEDTRTQRQQSLDDEVQQLKEEVLRIDQELIRLEERLVYPSSSQMALILSLEPSNGFSLDSVKVRLDDQDGKLKFETDNTGGPGLVAELVDQVHHLRPEDAPTDLASSSGRR